MVPEMLGVLPVRPVRQIFLDLALLIPVNLLRLYTFSGANRESSKLENQSADALNSFVFYEVGMPFPRNDCSFSGNFSGP